MTAVRTYPPGTVLANIRKDVTKDHMGFQFAGWPLANMQSKPLTWNVGMSDFRTSQPWGTARPANIELVDLPDYANWQRHNRPQGDQLWQPSGIGTGSLGSNSFGDVLKMLDFWNDRGCKVMLTLNFYIGAPLGWNNIDPFTVEYENQLAACLEAMFTSAQVGPGGVTFVAHPALGAIEVANEATHLTTDPTGIAHALAQRILYNKVKKYRPDVKVLGFAGSGGVSADIYIINSAEARSMAQTTVGPCTVDAALDRLTRTAHGLAHNELVYIKGPGLPSGFADYNTTYKVNVIDTTRFQILTNTTTPVVVGGTSSAIVFAELYVEATNGYQPSRLGGTNPAKYNPATREWSLANHGLVGSSIVRLKPYVAGGLSQYRRYFVKAVDANNFQLATRLDGPAVLINANPDNQNSFGVIVNRSTPAAIDGDDGAGRFQPEYVDAQTHHYYMSTRVMDQARASGTQYAIRAPDNRIPHDRMLNVHVDAVDSGERAYRMFGEMYVGAATVNATANTLGLNWDANMRAGQRCVIVSTGTIPAGLTMGKVYYVVNPNRAAKTFQLALTEGGAAIDLTSAGSGVINVYRLHPSYDTPLKKAVWNTEFNVVELPFIDSSRYVLWSELSPEERKVYLLRYAVASMMGTTDGAGGLGVSIFYGPDTKDTGGQDLSNIDSVQLHTDGNLRVNFSWFSSTLGYKVNERVLLRGNSNGIPGVVAPGADVIFPIIAVLSNTSVVLDCTTYSGTTTPAAVGNAGGYFQRLCRGPFVPEFEWFHDLLMAGPVTYGWIYYPAQNFYGIMVHFTGQRPMYTTPDGVLHEW